LASGTNLSSPSGLAFLWLGTIAAILAESGLTTISLCTLC
jgi:hypothetical protein